MILALTPACLDNENLKYFLDYVKQNGIGGLFIWNCPTLDARHLETICTEGDGDTRQKRIETGDQKILAVLIASGAGGTIS